MCGFLWSNDLNDLEREKDSNILLSYLNKKIFSRLKSKQTEIDILLKSKLSEFEKMYSEQLLDDNKLKYKYWNL